MDIKSDGTHVTLYQYVPSDKAAYTFVALFGAGTVAHFFFMCRLRAAYFVPFIIGCNCEAGGYYGRAWSHRAPQSVKAYVLQSLLILSAPPFLAATIYMALGHIIQSLSAEKHAITKPRWLTKLFVLVDVICFISQMAGAGVQVSTSAGLQKIGVKVVLGGLIFQVIAFAFFVYVAWKFHVRLNREPTMISRDPAVRWKRYMWALYAVSIAVLVRNIVRIVEYAQGGEGFIVTHEVMIYIFDAFLMFFVVLIFAVIHPGWLVRAVGRAKKARPRGSMALLDGAASVI